MTKINEALVIELGDAQVMVPLKAVAIALLRQSKQPQIVAATNAPRVGELWPEQGGIYAGIVRGLDGASDYHLIVGPAFDGEIAWDAANSWATHLQLHGYSDFSLPTRREQRLLFCNAKEDQFEPGWYWSSEPDGAGSGCAWMQTFSDGGQSASHESSHCRARAVRRLPIR